VPLAVVRKQVKDLPTDFTLDDSNAMSPAARLSNATRVIVGARISKSGNPMSQPGDIEALSEPVAPGAQGLKLVLGAKLP
jgi:cytochrome c-type biogenesis protein CcmH